jgi:hypothetical protein
MNQYVVTQLKSFIEKLKKLDWQKWLQSIGGDSQRAGDGLNEKSNDPAQFSSSLSKAIFGGTGEIGEDYFPSELIGGCCPRVVGSEDSLAWNSAAESCDSERIHLVWQSFENKVWYVAVRSSELASHAHSWCPFASLLPGMKDAGPSPVCYTYYGDEMATLMAVTADTLQIYRGTTLVIRAKAERAARELGNAPVIDLVPDKIAQLTPVPWYSSSLFEDRARRILAAVSVFAALIFAGLAFLVWLSASMSLISSKHNLSEVQTRTRSKTEELLRITEKIRVSPMREQLAKFSELNDGLLALNGFLEIYEIKDGKTRWRAVIPANITADRINQLGGKTIESTPKGIAIGNAAEVDYEATAGRKP